MNDSQCMARLLASAVHDMRNVLAVIRESAGLAQDIALPLARQAAPGGAPGPERLVTALGEVQRAVIQGAALSEAMDYMAQAGGADSGGLVGPCDLARVCRGFCFLAARQARAAQMTLCSADTEGPVWANVPVLAVLRSLLDIFDVCAAVGGQAGLRFTAGRRQKEEGIVVAVLDGANRELALAALTGSPMLSGLRPGWRAALMPWRHADAHFFLSIAACGNEGE